MYAIYDKHIDLYKKQMQDEVLAEIAREDELMKPHMDFCNQIGCEGTQHCTQHHCKTGEGGHRANEGTFHELSANKKALTRWERFCKWFREFRKSLILKKS